HMSRARGSSTDGLRMACGRSVAEPCAHDRRRLRTEPLLKRSKCWGLLPMEPDRGHSSRSSGPLKILRPQGCRGSTPLLGSSTHRGLGAFSRRLALRVLTVTDYVLTTNERAASTT